MLRELGFVERRRKCAETIPGHGHYSHAVPSRFRLFVGDIFGLQ